LLFGLALLGYAVLDYLITGVKHHVKALIGLGFTTLGGIGALVSLLSIYLKRVELRFYRRIRELERRLTRS